MAICVWTGATSGDWTVAGNWDTGVPVDNDTVHINTGTRQITGDLSTVEPILMRVGPNFLGSFGASVGAPAKIAPVTLTYAGGGDTDSFLSLGAANVTTVQIEKVGSTGDRNLYLIVNTGTLANLSIRNGTVLHQSGTITQCHLEALNGIVANAKLYQQGGTITTLDKGVGTFYHSSGTCASLNADTGLVVLSGNAVVTTLRMAGNNPSVVHKSTGTISRLRALAGTFDGSQDAQAKTITDIDIHEGAIVDLRNLANNIVVTNGVRQYGGTVYAPNATVVSYA